MMIDKRLRANIIIFSPVIVTIMLCTMNKVSGNAIAAVFGETIEFVVFLYSFMIFLLYILFMFQKPPVSFRRYNSVPTLLRVLAIIASFFIFFAIIYLILYRLSDQTAFIGTIGEDLTSQFITFLYFSAVTLASVGYGDISAVTNMSRLIVLLEIALEYIMIFYTITSFAGYKEHLKTKLPYGARHTTIDETEKAKDVSKDVS